MAKKKPHDSQAERSVLGSIILDHEAMDTTIGILKPDDFYDKPHKIIYEAMVNLYKNNIPIDTTTLKTELIKMKEFNTIGGFDYLIKLVELTPTSARIKHYSEIVWQKSRLREVQNFSEKILELSFDNKSIKEIEQEIKQLSSISFTANLSDENDSTEDVLVEILEDLESGSKKDFIQTNYSRFDTILGGLEKSRMHIIAARPSVGKTAFFLNLIGNILKADPDKQIVIFSLEMKKKQLLKRLLSAYTNIEAGSFLDGLDDNEKEILGLKYKDFAKTFKNLHVFDRKRYTIEECASIMQKIKQDHGHIDIAVIDHIGLLRPGKRYQNRNAEISDISAEIKGLSAQFDCHFIALSQLKRIDPETRRPRLSDLRDSGSLEQDGDLVTLLHRPDYQNDKVDDSKKDLMEVNIAKNRDGWTGKLDFIFKKEYQKIYEKEVKHQ